MSGGMTVRLLLGRDHVVRARERRDDRAERGLHRRAAAVEQHQRPARAVLLVVHGHAVDVSAMCGPARRRAAREQCEDEGPHDATPGRHQRWPLMRTGTPSSAAELLDELGGVEVVLQPRDAVAIDVEQRERPHRLAVDVLVPVHEDKPIAMAAHLDARQLGQHAGGELRVEGVVRARHVARAEQHAREHGALRGLGSVLRGRADDLDDRRIEQERRQALQVAGVEGLAERVERGGNGRRLRLPAASPRPACRARGAAPP